MNIHVSPSGAKTATKTIKINAPPAKVWDVLTNPAFMKKWISETEVDILTDWQVGSPIITRGNLHRVNFENKGIVLQFEPGKVLEYTHLSSISRLRDEPENYSIFEFRLTPIENQTTLMLTLSNFPTETIYKHLIFYWNVTLEIIKKMVEEQEG
jgi:uncharacterized protein YndB with AHSA1/START domain